MFVTQFGRDAWELHFPALRVSSVFVDLTPADVARSIGVSPVGGFLVAQQASRRMLPNRHGAILFTGASASVKGYS